MIMLDSTVVEQDQKVTGQFQSRRPFVLLQNKSAFFSRYLRISVNLREKQI